MNRAFTIRVGTAEDLATVQELNVGLYNYENSLGFFDDSFDLNWTYSQAGTEYFSALLNKSNLDSVAFLAIVDNQAVGYIAAGLKSPTYRSTTPIAEVENMFMLESFRNSGIGTALVNEFKLWALNKDAKRIRVAAFAGNSSIAFYEKCGFKRFEVLLEARLATS